MTHGSRVLERCIDFLSRDDDRRRKPEQQCRQYRYRKRETEDASVRRHVNRKWGSAAGNQSQKYAAAPGGEEQPQRTTRGSEQQTLGEELANQP